MTNVKSSDCRAKDPSTCRYHGAVLRMEQALARQDITSYIAARDEVDALKQDPKNDFTAPQPLSKPVANSVDPRRKDRKTKHDRELRDRAEYLKDTAAVPTPMEAFALWVSVYESQGGKIQTYDSTYESFGNVISNNPKIKSKDFDYESLAWSRWTPTKGNVPIPAGYGSARLQLFVLPDVVEQPMTKSGRINGTPDSRRGWEWGHTEVFTLVRNEDGSLFAATNKTGAVTTYADVDRYRRGKSIAELTASLAKIQADQKPLDQ